MPPAPRPALTRAPVRPHPLAPAGVAEPTPAPEATTVMDWFHVTMRLTVLTQLAKGLRAPPPAASADSVAAGGGARRPLASWVSTVRRIVTWNQSMTVVASGAGVGSATPAGASGCGRTGA